MASGAESYSHNNVNVFKHILHIIWDILVCLRGLEDRTLSMGDLYSSDVTNGGLEYPAVSQMAPDSFHIVIHSII